MAFRARSYSRCISSIISKRFHRSGLLSFRSSQYGVKSHQYGDFGKKSHEKRMLAFVEIELFWH